MSTRPNRKIPFSTASTRSRHRIRAELRLKSPPTRSYVAPMSASRGILEYSHSVEPLLVEVQGQFVMEGQEPTFF
jgi:hypothetical protein